MTQRSANETSAPDDASFKPNSETTVSGTWSSNRTMTPLWVISLFISLTETVLGVAATQVSGNLQITLTVFVITFPLLIAGGFFAILWFRPYVLYPPTDFRSGADVSSYVDAMQRRADNESRIHELIEDSLARAGQKLEQAKRNEANRMGTAIPTTVSPDIAALVRELAKSAITNVEKQVLRVDARPIRGPQGPVQMIPYDSKRSLYDFLTDIFYLIHNDVPPFTYGTEW